jgi:hypothetical protein
LESDRVDLIRPRSAVSHEPCPQRIHDRPKHDCGNGWSITPTRQSLGEEPVTVFRVERLDWYSAYEPTLFDRKLDAEIGDPKARGKPDGSQHHQMADAVSPEMTLFPAV